MHVSHVYMLSKEPPAPIKKGKVGLDEALEELEEHVDRLKTKFGSFNYAPIRTPYKSQECLEGVRGKKDKSPKKSGSPKLSPAIGKESVKTESSGKGEKSSPVRRSPESAEKKQAAIKNKYNSIITTRRGAAEIKRKNSDAQMLVESENRVRQDRESRTDQSESSERTEMDVDADDMESVNSVSTDNSERPKRKSSVFEINKSVLDRESKLSLSLPVSATNIDVPKLKMPDKKILEKLTKKMQQVEGEEDESKDSTEGVSESKHGESTEGVSESKDGKSTDGATVSKDGESTEGATVSKDGESTEGATISKDGESTEGATVSNKDDLKTSTQGVNQSKEACDEKLMDTHDSTKDEHQSMDTEMDHSKIAITEKYKEVKKDKVEVEKEGEIEMEEGECSDSGKSESPSPQGGECRSQAGLAHKNKFLESLVKSCKQKLGMVSWQSLLYFLYTIYSK